MVFSFQEQEEKNNLVSMSFQGEQLGAPLTSSRSLIETGRPKAASDGLRSKGAGGSLGGSGDRWGGEQRCGEWIQSRKAQEQNSGPADKVSFHMEEFGHLKPVHPHGHGQSRKENQ